MNPIQVGLLGIGTVGSGTFEVLRRNQAEIQRRAGRSIRIAMVADLDTARARRIVGDAADRWLTFCDPESRFASALGLERLPAFVHLRQDTSLVAAAQGWSVSEWQRVADELAKKEHWTSPRIAAPGNPRPTPGWALSA